MMKKFRALALAAAILAGCSSNYIYLPPVSTSYIPVDVDEEEDLIPYCPLRVSYFEAEEPPPAYRGMKNRVAAATTVVLFTPRGIIDPVENPANPDSTRWVATTDPLKWEARFVTKASWWNPKTKGKFMELILEHEQGHFTIAELEMRRENARPVEAGDTLRVAAPTIGAAVSRMAGRIARERQRLMQRVNAWQAKYDLETKNGTDVEVQHEWTKRLEDQLAEWE